MKSLLPTQNGMDPLSLSTYFRVVFYTLLSVLKWVDICPSLLEDCFQDVSNIPKIQSKHNSDLLIDDSLVLGIDWHELWLSIRMSTKINLIKTPRYTIRLVKPTSRADRQN